MRTALAAIDPCGIIQRLYMIEKNAICSRSGSAGGDAQVSNLGSIRYFYDQTDANQTASVSA